ncbi:CHAT domain-containing protein [Thermoactinospora rubra]|uniref:CHAT domain-containing protein n=1 Tax=Thermoactinospora rubra TaxID=1088767 RepID=UPI000A109D58|nr:CHAT domain-containing protein [Thermoactinospora rubra]
MTLDETAARALGPVAAVLAGLGEDRELGATADAPPAEEHTFLVPEDGLVGAAEAAVLQSVVDPARALAVGRAVLAVAERQGVGRHRPILRPAAGHHHDGEPPAAPPAAVEAAAVALRAMALAARELGDLPAAEHFLRRAIALPGAPPARVAQARLSLVTVRTERGHPLQALRIAALARPALAPGDRAKLDTQRAVALAHLGRYDDAVAACDRAIEALDAGAGAADDRRFLAGGLLNRGLVHAYRGEWAQAMDDVTRCLDIAREAGLDHLARLAAANLPFMAVRQGDIAAAFAHYRASQETLFGFPERLATMRTDFAGALLAARLPGEARTLLRQAVPDLEASGARVALAEARLKLAQVELLAGDARRAVETAERARAELLAQDRAAWAPLADEVIMRARAELEPATPGLLAGLAECADRLERGPSGAPGAAALRLAAAETALALGSQDTARQQLARVPRDATVISCHALALRAVLDGDHARALRSAMEGLSLVGRQAAALGDPTLRAHAAREGERLAAFGLRRAVAGGAPGEVYGWAERWRALAATGSAEVVALAELRAALGGAVLVEFVADGDRLLALLADDRGVALHRLCPVRPAAEAVIRLRYALRRLTMGDGGAAPYRTRDVTAAAGELERLVMREPAGRAGDRPMVIVPAGPLHSVPWAALPCLRGRPVSVAASARAWHAARRPPCSRPPLVAACDGPGLRHAAGEVRAVLETHRRTRRVAARRAEVLGALGQADVVHLAAHGVFDARSPLLSSVALDDGALMAYDLLSLDRAPRLVVLSACDTGMARIPAEGAPLGLAGTFLSRGAGCVVAGLVPVPDEETADLMRAFHALLALGRPPAEALAEAAVKTGALGFACFGAGDQPLSTGLAGSATQLDHDPT